MCTDEYTAVVLLKQNSVESTSHPLSRNYRNIINLLGELDHVSAWT